MPSTNELRKSYLDAAKSMSTKPLYAWAGAGELAVEKLRAVPDKVRKLRTEVSVDKIKAVPGKFSVPDTKNLTAVPGKLANSFSALPKTPKAISSKLTEFTECQVKAADAKFDELAERGESIVKRVRAQKPTSAFIGSAKATVAEAKGVQNVAARGARSTTAAAKTTVTTARKTAVKATSAASAAANKVGK